MISPAHRSPHTAHLRLGRIGYVNCYPVYGAIDRGIVAPPAKLVTGTPSELNDLLAAGELDLSVVSAVEYARNAASYHLLPDLAVSSDGPVQSVCLFSRRPAEELDQGTILLSASSRTSVFLLQLLCQDLWRVRPRFAEARAEAADLSSLAGLPHDAVLIIGDSALVLAGRGTYSHKYDLGEVWKRWTGLPFVFAVWAARREADHEQVQEVHQALLASRAWGLAHLNELAAQAAEVTGVPVPACLDYLSGLDYGLGYKELEGLTSFLRRLAARGMVREGALAFLSVA
jgi:chorismate dehydratase